MVILERRWKKERYTLKHREMVAHNFTRRLFIGWGGK
jgi:hypothetical protein